MPQIQSRLENLMKRAEKVSTLASLRCLQAAHQQLGFLVEDLKAELSTSERSDLNANPLNTLLDQNLEDLFVPYVEDLRYLEREKKSLQELYASFLYKFSSYHVRNL